MVESRRTSLAFTVRGPRIIRATNSAVVAGTTSGSLKRTVDVASWGRVRTGGSGLIVDLPALFWGGGRVRVT